MRTTLDSTMALLDVAKEYGVKMIVNTGTSSEYGTRNHSMHEDELIEPNSYYAVGKVAQTLYCQQFAREEKLPIITLRLFSVYGPQEDPTRFIPTLLTKTLANEDVPLADPTIARDFIYLDEVIDAYRAAMMKPELSGEVFNISTGTQHTLKEAFDMAVLLTDSTSKALLGARTDGYELLAAADVFAQPFMRDANGRVWKGPNTSQTEACVAGVSSVSTRIPFIEYLIEDSVTGLLTRLNDPSDLASRIHILIEDPVMAKRLAQEASVRVAGRYSLVSMGHAYDLIYQLLPH